MKNKIFPNVFKLLLLLSLVACSTVSDKSDPTDPAMGEMLVIGEAEYLYVNEAACTYDARIDTGATTCSIHAEDIAPFERDDEQWIKFTLVNPGTKERTEITEKLVRVVTIKQHESDSVKRYVVLLKVFIGRQMRTFEFTLADRSDYSYPLLVGRNLLRGHALVDVSQSYTLSKPGKQTIEQSMAK
ncbi:ATP-dependent zinc protease family protein [Pontiella sulfatireligans]|nr:ATP-dependent zinc protease [Pontiella sulfatireligans]